MQFFKFKLDKAIVAMQLLLQMYGGEVNLHKLFKTLYFAEQKHLVRYGRAIVGDRYIAMKAGPVPSNIYDLVKLIRGDNSYFTTSNSEIDLKSIFQIHSGHKIKQLSSYFDKSFLSESDIECLSESFGENKDLNFTKLSEKSHDLAWKNADRNDDISPTLIASAGGAKEELLKYIELNIENENLNLNAFIS